MASFYDLILAGKLSGGGGGGGSGITIAEWTSREKPSGDLDITGLSFLRDYAFANCIYITSVKGTPATSIGQNTFQGCTGITTIHIIGQGLTNTFLGCTGMITAVFLSGNNHLPTGLLNGCTNLEIADLETTRLRNNDFANDNKLATIILRNTSVAALESTAVLAINHYKSGGSGGEIYIPKSLYDHLGDGTSSDYKAATNWSTVNGYGTITWKKIEGSIYETQYADGTPIGS